MSPSSDAADAHFWKAYGSAIKKAVGDATVNDKTAFYLSTKSQRGPPGGNGIAESFTNEGLSNIGNNLLPPDQLFYSPSTENSYIRQLQTYLAWVDVGGTPSSANVQAVTDALNSMRAADTGATKALTEALASYKAQKGAGIVGSQDFASWFPANAPAYTIAVSNYQSKAAAYQKATKMAYGALADQKLADEAKLNLAMSIIKNEPGFNMACGLGSPPSAKEINDATTAGQSLKDPNTVWRAMYKSQNYISSAEGSAVSESTFNKTTGSGGVGFSYAPWVSFSANASHSDEHSSLDTSEFESHIKITVNYNDISLVPINPSASWDLGDVRTKYQKLLEKAPESVKTLVKPTMMVLATRLGYTVDVGAAGKDTFDSMAKSVTSGGGSVSIFGIPCSFSAQASTEDEKITHRANWNSANNTFTVAPTDNCGFATIVGLVGEKIVTM